MRLLVVSLPHTNTVLEDFPACAFTVKVINFCRMMMDQGKEVFLFSGDKNEAPCTEHIPCISEKRRLEAVGDGHYTEAPWDITTRPWKSFIHRVIGNINERLEEGDIICVIGGSAHKPIGDAFPDHLVVEFGVGYGGVFAKYRVFESYAWMHMHYGSANPWNPNSADGLWYDAVIPGYLDPKLFGPVETYGDYYLFIGRLIDRKGYRIAVDIAKKMGKTLIVAGPGTPPDDEHVQYVGVIGPEERAKLMRGAIATIVPTQYVEPFGNVAIEAMASGCPVITTDWGAFTETVQEGVTGWRCRTFSEFVSAATKAQSLTIAERKAIRKYAISRYSLDVIGTKYVEYFQRLIDYRNGGWYAE